ncbi:MAG TPA: ATP-binding protein [Magnetospirillum sp.]|nr:ATP-binding protein [Magnetospirillum sp.]
MRTLENEARFGARLVAEHVLKVFETQTLAIELLEAETQGMSWDQIARSELLHHHMAELTARCHGCSFIWLVDGEGIVRLGSTIFPAPPVNVRDRDYFQSAPAGGGYYVSKPYMGRVIGLPAFAFSKRRIDGRQGFDGIISVAMNQDYFRRFFLSALNAREGMVALLRTDGSFLVHVPDSPLDKAATDSALITGAAADRQGVFRSSSRVDGVERIVAFEQLEGYSLLVAFGLDVEEALLPWRKTAWRNGLLAMMCSSLLAITIHGLALRARRNRAERSELKRLVDERTVELQRLLDAKTRLLASVGHDLRQPLQSLSLFSSVLAGSPLPAREAAALSNIQLSVDRMGQLLDAILQLAKLDLGTATVERRPFAVDEVIAPLVAEMAPQAHAKGLKLRYVPTRQIIVSDPALLTTIMRNLITNSIRYTQRGGIVVGCRTRTDATELVVYDTGRGIPSDQLEKVFEEFYQLGNSARDFALGTGLGLAIVERMTRLLEHEVRVESVEHRGSLFAVRVAHS